MRIGELAALVGTSTRAVRHYHHVGLLPEPERRANGYRSYSLRDAVLLARIRRLTELGLSLTEIRGLVTDDRRTDLRELLTKLDSDLARQEHEIRDRRARLAGLLEQGSLDADDPVSPEMAAVLGGLPRSAGGVVALERQWLAMLDTIVQGPEREQLMELMDSLTAPPDQSLDVARMYAAIDELEDAAPDDPRIAVLAEHLATLLSDRFSRVLPEPGGVGDLGELGEMQQFLADLAPAQAEAVRRAFALVAERSAGPRSRAADGRAPATG
ncbi:MAG TPA: MerR family transcriptional regulator [Pseudonocardia sp.]|nr:MerR family transcriptional regulator [Pseudonocardia sp.]